MSWKNNALYKTKPASASLIQSLKEVSPIELPRAYYELLSYTNGGEWGLAKQPYIFVADPVETVINSISSGEYNEFFPGFVMIGSNGAGEFISLDIREGQPWPVVAIDMTNIDLPEGVLFIANNFETFLQLIGVTSPELT